MASRCSFLTAYPELQLEPIHTPVELPSHSPPDSELLGDTASGSVPATEIAAAGDAQKLVELSPRDSSLLSASNTRFGLSYGSSDSKLPAAVAALVAQLARIQAPASLLVAGYTSASLPSLGGSNPGANGPPLPPSNDPTSFATFNALLRGEESRSTPQLAASGQRSAEPRGEKRKEPENDTCHRSKPPGGNPPQQAVFLIREWREKLCRCKACMRLYTKRNVTFLLDENDTVAEYEEQARVNGEGSRSLSDAAEDSLDGFMQSMPRFQQMEMIQGYNDMAAGLREYLVGSLSISTRFFFVERKFEAA
jgi:hypothetical protein